MPAYGTAGQPSEELELHDVLPSAGSDAAESIPARSIPRYRPGRRGGHGGA